MYFQRQPFCIIASGKGGGCGPRSVGYRVGSAVRKRTDCAAGSPKAGTRCSTLTARNHRATHAHLIVGLRHVSVSAAMGRPLRISQKRAEPLRHGERAIGCSAGRAELWQMAIVRRSGRAASPIFPTATVRQTTDLQAALLAKDCPSARTSAERLGLDVLRSVVPIKPSLHHLRHLRWPPVLVSPWRLVPRLLKNLRQRR
jgi:hypothetical protein